MGLFGGSSQSSQSLSSNIDFSPVIQFGSEQDAGIDKTTEQTSTSSPSLKDEGSLSAVVPVGSSTGSITSSPSTGSGADTLTQNLPSTQGLATAQGTPTLLQGNNLAYIIGGFVVLGGIYFFTKKKGK